MNRRRASLLAEAVICMSIGSSLMLLAIVVAHQAMTIASRAREQSDVGRDSRRLAQQFRTDVHGASQIVVENDSQRLRVEYANDASVVYNVAGGRITRERSPSAGQPTEEIERESYDFGADSLTRFAALDDPKRAELLIRSEHKLYNETPRLELYLSAAVGKLSQAELSAGDEP